MFIHPRTTYTFAVIWKINFIYLLQIGLFWFGFLLFPLPCPSFTCIYILFYIDLYLIIPDNPLIVFIFLPCVLGSAWPTRWKRWKWWCGPNGKTLSPSVTLGAMSIIFILLYFLCSSQFDNLLLNLLPEHETFVHFELPLGFILLSFIHLNSKIKIYITSENTLKSR